ncbi:extracellular solute-binding protein [Nocardioides sp. P5_C9_2]
MLRRLAAAGTAMALCLALAACSDDGGSPEPPQASATTDPPTASPTEVTRLSFGAYGSADELAAFQQVVDAFNVSSTTRKVDLVTWPDHEAALEAVLAGEAPDVFMASRRDLRPLTEAEATQPVSQLLDERGVDFGDRYSRDAVDAFALDDELQCMAYSVSPMVIYYNDELVDFDKMERRGLDVPGEDAQGDRTRWNLAEFTAAAQFATRRGSADGVWIEPTLQGLAPFIYSGGGKVVDDADDPTSLALSDEATVDALDRTLAVLRDSALTPSPSELEESSALQRFRQGKLAMIAGFRDLVPDLRQRAELSFDTIAMPTLEEAATVGDIDGLCISADTEHVNEAADFLAYAVSDSAIETVTRTGYIVPANTEVAGSEVFLGPGRQPLTSKVFNTAIRGMVVPPLLDNDQELSDAVGPLIDDLVTDPGVLDLEQATETIDEASRAVLSPEDEPSESPSE